MPSTVSRLSVTAATRRASLLILLAAALLALPLLLLLHHQAGQRAVLLAMRTTLDPLTASVAVQAAVQQHEAATQSTLGAVPPGQDDTPAGLRRVWQAEVEARSLELEQVLLRGQWERALGELAAMRDDWARLVERIERRRIASADSATAHRLIVEQLLTVADLAAPRMALHRPRAGATLIETELALARADAAQAEIATRLAALEKAQRLVLAALALLAVATAAWVALLRRSAKLATQTPAAAAVATSTPTTAMAESLYGDPPRSEPELQMRSLLATLQAGREATVQRADEAGRATRRE